MVRDLWTRRSLVIIPVMKRLLCIIFLSVCILTSALAFDVVTEITNFQMHPDFWAGLLPSYISYKFKLQLVEFIPQHDTEISVRLSTGIIPRTITQNPLNGAPLSEWRDHTDDVEAVPVEPVDPLIVDTSNLKFDTSELIEAPYDTMAGGWSFLFGQGFGGERVKPKKDTLFGWFSFDGQWEKALNPILQLQRQGYPFLMKIFEARLIDTKMYPLYVLNGTPDLRGDQQMLSMSFNIGFDINMLKIQTARMDGLDLQAKITWAPLFLSQAFAGKADYIRIWTWANYAKTLFQSTTESGVNNWSLVLDDQAEIRLLFGSLIPKYAQTTEGKVWGLEPDNLTLFCRNSLKLRYYGETFLNGLCVPSAYVFLDLGYAAGNYNNTEKSDTGSIWTGSVGINIDLQLFEILHIYYEVGYIFLAGTDTTKQGFSIPSMVKFLVKINF